MRKFEQESILTASHWHFTREKVFRPKVCQSNSTTESAFMPPTSKNEVNELEALLLGDGGDETEHTEFTSDDVELLLADDDVNAFDSESFDDTSNANKGNS